MKKRMRRAVEKEEVRQEEAYQGEIMEEGMLAVRELMPIHCVGEDDMEHIADMTDSFPARSTRSFGCIMRRCARRPRVLRS